MNTAFESLIDGFLENRVGLADNFLSVDLATHLRNNLSSLFAADKLKEAAIGNHEKRSYNKQIRSDRIFWLDRKNNNVHENVFFDLMDEFVIFLNRTCYAGITGYEFHYALYEPGSFYHRHLDQFKNSDKRAFSMIMYLNENRQPTDGGELRIYHANKTQTITPDSEKCVFFASDELEHEVLISNSQRMSVTGWLRRDKPI